MIYEYLDRLFSNKYFLTVFSILLAGNVVYQIAFYEEEQPQRFIGPPSLHEQLAGSSAVVSAIQSYCAIQRGRNPDLIMRADIGCRERVMPRAVQVLMENEMLSAQVAGCLLLEADSPDLDELALLLDTFDLRQRCVEDAWPGGIASLFTNP